MRTLKTLNPGQTGTKALLTHYGTGLLFARYRYDEVVRHRLNRAELMIHRSSRRAAAAARATRKVTRSIGRQETRSHQRSRPPEAPGTMATRVWPSATTPRSGSGCWTRSWMAVDTWSLDSDRREQSRYGKRMDRAGRNRVEVGTAGRSANSRAQFTKRRTVLLSPRSRVALVICLLLTASTAIAQSEEVETIDFLTRLESSPDLAAQIGWTKLTATEKKNLNDLLNLIFRAGREAGATLQSEPIADSKPSVESAPRPTGSVVVYRTKVESAEDAILRLENGAVIEVTSGYLGYLGYRKDAVLFRQTGSCRVWIEGKKTFRCLVLREPSLGRPTPADLVFISEVKANGSLLLLDDGSILEVDSVDTITTALWLGFSEALLMDDTELINLEQGDEVVSVTRIR